MMQVVAQAKRLSAFDGTEIFINDYLLEAPAQCRGGVVIMHGLGEHCGRHAHVARFFNDCGYSVRTYDHRGHGKSGGARGDIASADAILQDAKIVIDDFAVKFQQPPLLLGHSMGGLFAARFALARLSPLSGLILSSPALAVELSGPQKLLLKILSKLAPGLAIPNGLDADKLSRDPKVAQLYRKDPMVHDKITSRLLLCMLDAMAFCHANAATMNLPVLMLVAGADALVDASGSRAFYPKLPTKLATWHGYDEMYHEIFNEPDAGRVFGDLRSWLEQQFKSDQA
ncbi:MAG: hypothetical protein RL748_209 [Pseudomonadota bacterium]|jgi:alpha-beta hydrolase superfamily lysophospholipase